MQPEGPRQECPLPPGRKSGVGCRSRPSPDPSAAHKLGGITSRLRAGDRHPRRGLPAGKHHCLLVSRESLACGAPCRPSLTIAYRRGPVCPAGGQPLYRLAGTRHWLADAGGPASPLAEIRPEFTHHAQIVGTLAYLAPEQTGRTSRPVDQRADLYALGATLYELATGEPPFGSGDPLRLVHDHLARVPVPPAEVNPAIPAERAMVRVDRS